MIEATKADNIFTKKNAANCQRMDSAPVFQLFPFGNFFEVKEKGNEEGWHCSIDNLSLTYHDSEWVVILTRVVMRVSSTAERVAYIQLFAHTSSKSANPRCRTNEHIVLLC